MNRKKEQQKISLKSERGVTTSKWNE